MRMRATSGERSFMVSRLARTAAALAIVVIGFAAAAAHGQTATRPFAALRPASGPAATAHALVVELSPREVLSGAHVELAPKGVLPIGSRYAVWVNGKLAATADARDGDTRQTLPLAPNAFAPGVNTIQLALASRAVPLTNDIAITAPAPVDDTRSALSLDFAGLRPNPAPTLAQIPLAFDARAWLPRTVTVDLGQGEVVPEELDAATLAVQAIAARMRQVNLTVAYRSASTLAQWSRDPQSWGIAEEDTAAGDVLLVGTRATLSRELPASVAGAVTGPFVGLYPANAGKSVVVVISGLTDVDCVRAARMFADTSASLPPRPAMVVGGGTTVRASATRVAVTLAESDPALVRAVLRFAAVRAKTTGEVAEFASRYSGDASGTNFYFGQDSALSSKLRRHLPSYAPLQPGQAVSLPAHIGAQPFVAIVGVRNAAVAGAVDMLRKPAAWSLFTQRATLFDTRAESAIALATAARSPLAEIRLFLADPVAFWSVLAALLLASFVFVNLALKAQVAGRLDATGRQSSRGTPNKTT